MSLGKGESSRKGFVKCGELASVVKVNPGGTGSPMETISAKLAPLFPNSSSCLPAA